MKDIRSATASEPLTLEQEYAMQSSWQTDADKLTFIICRPEALNDESDDHAPEINSMIGDVNLFVSVAEEDDGSSSLVGEIELMIARRDFQRQGNGRAALLCFLQYIAHHEQDILGQFTAGNGQQGRQKPGLSSFTYLAVKINETNERSLRLFKSMGFEKESDFPNFFGEFEMRRSGLSVADIEMLMKKYAVESYQEGKYGNVSVA